MKNKMEIIVRLFQKIHLIKSNSVSSIDLVKAQLPDVIAILEIPKINLKVQVYPTTNEMVLREGIGVLDGTSLPIGEMEITLF